ncbi:hypothetical protein [Sphaerisporangium dianthi]|uniref:DUF2489 domain-containing protein n=1 Tax=Sphaerisporangium dianthi TaxID=1436120 RepID=A0ABV9CJ96_9ACTN
MWNEWVDLVAALAGLAAVFFAIVAVRQASKQAAENMEALRLERRIDFELNVLSQLAEYNEKGSNVFGADARVRTLAGMLPEVLIPLTRSAVSLPSTPEADARTQQARPGASEARESLRNEIADEIYEAIQKRLEERK